MEKWKVAEYEGETLQIQQQVAKTKACARILEEIDENHLQKFSLKGIWENQATIWILWSSW